MAKSIRAITIRQPWASACVLGRKVVENRSYSTRPGLLIVHAGLTVADAEIDGLPSVDQLPRGVLLGAVNVTAAAPYSRARFGSDPLAVGPWCWMLADPVAFRRPIPWTGNRGIWSVPVEVVRAALEEGGIVLP